MNVQLKLHLTISSSYAFHPPFQLIKLHATRSLSVAYAVTIVIIVFPYSTDLLTSGTIMKYKQMWKYKAKKSCYIYNNTYKIKILSKMHGDISTAEVGLTFCWYKV